MSDPAESALPPQELPAEKPKRNWRGFLKEYAVIVIGVLTALAAQQAAEWWQWRGQVTEARKALRDEIAATDRTLMRRIAIHPCLVRQEKEARAILDSLDGKGAAPPFMAFRHPQGGLLADSEWQSERSSQVLTHFPRAELALMSTFYGGLPVLEMFAEKQGDEWTELSVLRNAPARMEPSDILRLRATLAAAHRHETLTLLFAYRMLKLSDNIGAVRPSPEPGFAESFCKTDEEKSDADNMNAAMKP